ncbi:MAG: 30S ribosomal protein S6 [Patescibacteria group bacterium]
MVNSESESGELVVYELGFLILPSIPENKLSNVTDAIRKIISKESGTELDAEAPFKETLAYAMSKTVGVSRYVVSDAYLGWIKFEIDRARISMIKTGVEKIDEILRFLLIKAPRETTFTFAKAKVAAVVEESVPKEIDGEIIPTESLELENIEK